MEQVGFAFGIRTVKSFSIEDRLGAILDEILYSKDSEFNENLFPEMQENHNTKVLFNRKTLDKFTITPQDFIFEYSVKEDFDKEFSDYLKNFKQVIVNHVFSDFKIRNISRFGLIIKCVLDSSDNLMNDISSGIQNHFSTPDSLSLRFNVITKRPLKLGDIITEDYDNEIVTYDRPSLKSPVNFLVDYQKYFEPELNIIDDSKVSFDTFCLNSYNNFKTKYKDGKKK